MEEALSKGLTKHIGLSNYTITKTENLLRTAKIVPAVNQVECHPYLQQQKLKEYCCSKGGLSFNVYTLSLTNGSYLLVTIAIPVYQTIVAILFFTLKI